MDRLLPAIAAAFTASALGVFAWWTTDGLWRPDAFDYAQIARELYAGNGFSTRQAIYALHLEFLSTHGGFDGAWPSLHRFPLPSLAIAASFALLGVGSTAVIAYGIAFHALTSALVFTWGRAASGLPVACASTFLVTINGAMLETAPSGLAEPPAIFFFTLALYWLWRSDGHESVGAVAISGAALGLAALTRTDALFTAPVLLLCILARNPRRRDLALWWTLALGVVLSPWLIRNAIVAESPFFSLHSYFLLPAGTEPGGLKWDVSQRWVHEFVSPVRFLLEEPAAVFAKWSRNLSALVRDFPTLSSTFLLPLVALAALLPIPSARALRGPAVVLFGCFALHAALVSFTDVYFDKYHFQFLPGLVLLATALVWRAIEHFHTAAGRGLAFGAIVLAMAHLPNVIAAGDRVRAMTSRFDPDQMDFVRTHTNEDAVVMSDISYAVAWQAGRRSIRTHYDRLDDGAPVLALQWIEQRYLEIDAVYLSSKFTRGRGHRQTLALATDSYVRENFPSVHRFEDGALFFARKFH